MIRASAGSGKTWQLANRYLALVVLGVRPEKIIALTFTRKAAGEFADRILTMLADGAASSAGAADLSAQIQSAIKGHGEMKGLVSGEVDLPVMSQEFFQLKLAEMTKALDKLTLSTLDSYFVKIVRYFTFELGLAGFDLVQGSELDQEKLSVLTEMFSSQGKMAKSYQSFLEAFKLATMGNEEARLIDTLKDFINAYHYRWLSTPDVSKWGNPEALWDHERPWKRCADPLVKMEQAVTLLEGLGWHKSLVKSLIAAVEWLGSYEKGMPVSDLPSGAGRILENLSDIRSGEWVIPYSKKEYVAKGELLGLLDQLASNFVCCELELKMERTRGVFEVINTYEKLYQKKVRGQGKLSFSDIGLLLAGQDTTGLWDEVARELVDYRLDGRYDHWMLDEFQDTSRVQWAVIQNLIDEIMYSEEGTRSLFVVGDTKQGIYGWRGGDSELFNEVAERYSGRLTQSPMDKSWRSTPEVLDLLNLVCDPSSEAMRELFSEDSLARWDYEEHTAAKSGKGHAWVCEVQESDELEGKELQYAWVGGILAKVDPVKRNLSCAVIVRNNSHAKELGDYLRANCPDLPVAMDSEITVAEDNPVSYAICDAFRFLAHPGDSLASNHLKMSPLSFVMGFGESSDQSVWFQWNRKLNASDISEVLHSLILGLRERVSLSNYSVGRLHELERSAAQFVKRGGSLEDWVNEMEQWRQKEVTREGVVQIMTVHKSKGLGFDVVILPSLETSSFDSLGKLDLLEKKDPDGNVEHHLLFPQKQLALADEELQAEVDRWQSDQAYEAFCVHYVALSRAKSGIYCLLPKRGKSSTLSRRNSDWLRLALGEDGVRDEHFSDLSGTVLYESGSWNWLDDKESILVSPQKVEVVRLLEASQKAVPILASSHAGANIQQQLMSRGGLRVGLEVHQALESIEWHRGGAFKWTGNRRVQQIVQACLDVEEVAKLFTANPNIKLYREVAVEVLIDGDWVSGVIDRLHVSIGNGGHPISAQIIDFKTDASDDVGLLAERYKMQLDLYQKAVAQIFDLPLASISKIILLTHAKKVIPLS
ncbi:ATP-dependent helicase/nuclease subunit A [Rubritalea halochordaticola]|uniref:DNA 3'-5' helicase n=1 Tax=Rubritalea halochordaticola TaxID=714537 RepID=A0ABP9UZF7_9BACT